MSRVLVIEDELPARLRLADYLSSFSIGDVALAENGAQGLELFQSHEPDLIVTDIQMPVMDGLAFLEEVRRSGSLVPVIILSCHESFAYARKAIQLGVSGYLLKDLVSREELFLAIRRHIPEIVLPAGSARRDQLLSMAVRPADAADSVRLTEVVERLSEDWEAQKDGTLVISGIESLDVAEKIREAVRSADVAAHFGLGSGPSHQALKALEVAELYDRPDIMSFDRTMHLPGPVPSTVYRHLSQLDEALAAKDRSAAKASLVQLLSYRVPGFMQVRLREQVVYYILGIMREYVFRSPEHVPVADIPVPGDLTDSDQVIAELLDQIDLLLQTSNTSKRRIPEYVVIVMRTIRERYSENLTLEALAEAVNVHPGHLSRSFHANVGVTLRHYLVLARLEAAKEAMRSGERELRLIADRTGFRNYSHFSSTFSKIEGMSPSEYLRRYQ
ncbi:MAG: response regulator [Spirochaetales bacterium]